jgi:hypothetical protein
MVTKFVPQIAMTPRARKRWGIGMGERRFADGKRDYAGSSSKILR